MRRAEQRCPADWKAETRTSRASCSGRGGGVGDHGVDPAGLGDEGRNWPLAGGKRPVDGLGRGRGAGEGDTCKARVGEQGGSDGGAGAGEELEGVLRHARLMEEGDGSSC